MQLYLVRHSQPVIAPGCCYGRTDLPLPADGWQQTAAGLAALLGQLASPRLISSPLQRCRLLAEHSGYAFRLEPRWQELDFGDWERVPWEQIPVAELDSWNADLLHFRPGGAESLAEMRDRVLAALAAYGSEDGPIVAVTHAGVIRILLAHWLALAPAQMLGFRLDYGSVTRLECNGGRCQVHYVNRRLAP